MTNKFLTGMLCCLLCPIFAHAQLRPLTYFSQWSNGANWSGFSANILIGDINGDTVPDLVVSGNANYQLGYGEIAGGKLRFSMQPIQLWREDEYLILGQLVDFDGDGDLDYHTGMHRLPYQYATYIFENTGNALAETYYRPAAPLPDSCQLFFGHYDEDEILDVYFFKNQKFRLLKGSNGTVLDIPFANSNVFKTLDMNGDGRMDFLKQNTVSPALGSFSHELFLNRGDFTFDVFETAGLVYDDAHGDFDNDGVPDLLDDLGGGLKYRIKSNLKSQNEPVITDVVLSNTTAISPNVLVLDLNGDGFDDFIVTTRDSAYFCKNLHNLTFQQYVIPRGVESTLFRQHPDLPHGMAMGVTYEGAPIRLLFAFSENAGFSMEKDFDACTPFVLPRPTYGYPMATLDTDHDGAPELGIAFDGNVALAEWQAGQMAEYSALQAFETRDIETIAAADWDSDGHPDLLVSLTNGTGIHVARSLPDSTFSAPVFIATGQMLEGFDFDKNGYADLLLKRGNKIILLFNQGNSSFSEQEMLDFPATAVAMIDPDNDGFPDLALSKGNLSNGETFIFKNDGQNQFTQTQGPIAGILAKNKYLAQPYIFTLLGDPQTPAQDYRLELSRIAPSGTTREVLADEVFVDTLVNFREAWLLPYDNDSIPDMLFNFGAGSKAVLTNLAGNAQILSFPDSQIRAIEDLAGDGFPEVVWRIGPQIFVENIAPPMVSDVSAPTTAVADFQVFPNPVSGRESVRVIPGAAFSGQLNISVLSLDGRVLHTVWGSAGNDSVLNLAGVPGASCIVRVSDGQHTVLRVVVKL
ncbi:MAG: VCBS repeat-containing protein [Saprospiraceae bacterium]|nr:VCBS repeat-containing protein [Saprospiraceae bacterium]